MQIGRLEKANLRDIWRNESLGFTRWLSDNLDIISELIGKNLSFVKREAPTGSFFADILAEDENGNPVIIENQLEQTDHDHLGKLITYLSNYNAKIAIWITSTPRSDHERAVHWLNEFLPDDTEFWLLKLEAYRIGNSDPAPLLTIVAQPSPEGREIGEKKKELAERHQLRLQFWKELLEKARQKTGLHQRIAPSIDNWLGTGAGKSGLNYNYVIRMDDVQVELYIDGGDFEENKNIFDTLYSKKNEIEQSFGHSLDWQRLEDRRASRIRYLVPEYGLKDRDHWPDIQDKMIDAMICLHAALQPHIATLK